MAMFRTYTETYDLNTEEGCPTILAVHSPIGQTPYKMLAPAFKMYRKYKYLGADLTIVNAAKLPVDVEQLGRIEGTNYVDPRDVLNPILFKGCHGESLGKILDSMYNGLLRENRDFDGPDMDKKIFRNALANFYYTALGDDSWRKSHIQKTLNIKNLHPLVYGLDTNHQILPSNALSPRITRRTTLPMFRLLRSRETLQAAIQALLREQYLRDGKYLLQVLRSLQISLQAAQDTIRVLLPFSRARCTVSDGLIPISSSVTMRTRPLRTSVQMR